MFLKTRLFTEQCHHELSFHVPDDTNCVTASSSFVLLYAMKLIAVGARSLFLETTLPYWRLHPHFEIDRSKGS